ncbi:MAG: hypothetical protein SOZ59_03505, partial [Candidatus Limivivens sp.]|nr:hypothetical protein [Candidatus Limivivens sp.]
APVSCAVVPTQGMGVYYKSPGQQPCGEACLHAQTHGYWTGYPYEQAAIFRRKMSELRMFSLILKVHSTEQSV